MFYQFISKEVECKSVPVGMGGGVATNHQLGSHLDTIQHGGGRH